MDVCVISENPEKFRNPGLESRREIAIFSAKEDRDCEQEIQQSCKSEDKTCRLFTD
jgi:hypothetical protein